MKSTQRRLAAIVFTDIVGYSAMMQKDETIANRLRVRHRQAFRRLTDQYDGQIIQYFGDGTLSIYPSAAAAVEFALKLQQEMKGEPPVPLRVGIHTGDITFGEEDAYGDGVNIASRIQTMCIPGGIFISGKVHDDIKNHSHIKTKQLGSFRLKNIQHPVEIHAISNPGITLPDLIPASIAATEVKDVKNLPGAKSKRLAGFLALFFGVLGAHRFYLGQTGLGIAYLSVFSAAAFFNWGLGDFIPVIGVIAFIDAIILFSMSKLNFNKKYNKALLEKTITSEPGTTELLQSQQQYLDRQFEQYFNAGIKEFHNFDYLTAIANLTKASELKYDDPEVHFMLARSYSIIEESKRAFSHLDAAVAFGLPEPERIRNHGDLAYLRVQPEYDDFVKNGFRLPKVPAILPDDTDIPESDFVPSVNLLDQLKKLKKLRDQGILTEEEYLLQEEKLKGRDKQ